MGQREALQGDLLQNDPLRRQWKMIHLLYLYGGKSGLSRRQLWDAGVDCESDGMDPLVTAGMAVEDSQGQLTLTLPTQKVLELCTLGFKGGRSGDFRVDFPSVFVVMPYREPWESLYSEIVEPAVREANLECKRADRAVLIGDLSDNVWSQLAAAGLILADVSDRNPNVFYELGIAAAMGKDTLLLKSSKKRVPADFKGTLLYVYDNDRVDELRTILVQALRDWAAARRAQVVAALYDQREGGRDHEDGFRSNLARSIR